jgi:hypothetical protein
MGAAGQAANPFSLMLNNAQTATSPYTSKLGSGLKAYQTANAAMKAAGMGQRPPPPAAAPARPMGGGIPTYSAQQVLQRPQMPGPPGGTASMVGNAMGMGGMGGWQGLPPGLIQLLMKLQQQGGM